MKNDTSTLKTHRRCSVHKTPEKWKTTTTTTTITGHIGFAFEDNSVREITCLSYYIFFEKLRFQKVFRPHGNEKPPFSNSPGIKSVFKSSVFWRSASSSVAACAMQRSLTCKAWFTSRTRSTRASVAILHSLWSLHQAIFFTFSKISFACIKLCTESLKMEFLV